MEYFLRRVIFLIGTLWVAVTVNFFIPRAMPGNPVETMMARFHERGTMSPSAMKAITVMLGISHGNIFQQYGEYLNHVVHFNFGVSYTYFPYSVTYMISHALPWTLGLVGVATIFSFGLGTMFGIIAAMRRGKAVDGSLTILSSFTNTFPYFWFGLMALYFLSFVYHWFPLTGAYGASMTPNLSWSFIGSVAYHGFLPALTIMISSIGGWLLGMRNNMINALNEDYVLLATAKGLKPSWVAWMYVARNAILPNLTGFAMALGFVVGGSLLTEIVFSYPGIGYLLYNAVVNEDFPLMQGIFLIIVVCVVLANFVADLAYVMFDPRVRRGGAS
ncbi:MAG: ABC transporter permease [Firmicutes bacterium]|nr:ABC transporter permease [Bacillota bacterium]MCL5066492.1 ABC transporter permease [Bacillota bacterium]